MLFLFLLVATVFLAYANGANDSFKGTSTLYRSRTLDYRATLIFATAGLVAGSVASFFLADELVKSFSGQGLVSPDVSASLPFLVSIGMGGAATVMLATRIGFPISTTHALTGSLVGSGVVANAGYVDHGVVGPNFILPLLLSPILAVAVAAPLYRGAHGFVRNNSLNREICICVAVSSAPRAEQSTASLGGAAVMPQIVVGHADDCARLQSCQGRLFGISAQRVVDSVHMVSAFALCFARGLNDAPKIVALRFAAKALDARPTLLLVALAMAAGGWLHSRRIAETMGDKISTMNEGQALTANLVASAIVILASRFGLPFSTTHVTVGAITGIGIVNRTADFKVIRNILLSWVVTLPCGAAVAASTYLLVRNWG